MIRAIVIGFKQVFVVCAYLSLLVGVICLVLSAVFLVIHCFSPTAWSITQAHNGLGAGLIWLVMCALLFGLVLLLCFLEVRLRP